MKATKVIYWITTIALILFIVPGIFFMNSEMAIEGVRHLGLPERLRWEASIGSFIGGLILLLPIRRWRIRERGYVGLGLVYISALIGHLRVDGYMNPMSYSPVVAFAVLLVSYICYHRILRAKRAGA